MKSLSVGHAPFTMKRPIDNCQTTDFTNASIRKRLNPRSMIWLLCMHYHFQPNISFLPFTTPRTSRFYVLPKIHKTNNTGRPIVSACSCPMENISAFLDEVMTPLVRGLPTYVKDTNHDFHIFDSFRFDTTDPGQRFLITMDVKSLYTVIPNDCGLQALTCSSKKHDVKVPSTSTLIRPAELVLKLNANGSKMGPNYACVFVGYVEHQLREQYTGCVPQLHRRYIDDIVGAASCRREELEACINFGDKFHLAFQITSFIFEIELPVLDIALNISYTRI